MAKNKDGKHHDKKNDDNNELNDAVENISTPDEGTGDQRGHDRQNLQNTVTAATATGAESSDLADEINAALNENPSRAGREDQGGQRRAKEPNANDDDKPQGRGGNKAAQEPTNNGRDNNETDVARGNEPQSVGGNTPQGEPSGSGNNTPQSKGGITSEQQSAAGASGGRGGQDRNQEVDTATTSETFEVDVADAIAADLSFEDEFDTKNVSETIEIQVKNVNDEVVIDDEIAPMFDGVEDTQIVLTEAELLANASDVDGDDLSVENLSIENAKFEIEIDPDTGEKSFVVTPNENVNGELKVTFDVSDQNGSEVASGATLNVTAVNDAAVVTSTDIDGTEDTAITFTQEMLLQNATDIDSSDLTAINLHIDKEYGDLVDNGDGTFTFTPAADFNGDVPFTFEVDDNDGAITATSGTLDIAAVNDAPVLAETSYIVNEDGSIVITEASLIANAKDVDNDVLSVASISADEHGTVTQNDNGDWVYTLGADYSGDANLTITLNDGTVDATFNAPVTITPDADAPSLTVSLTDMTLMEYGVGQDSTLTGWHTDNHHNHIEIHQDYVYGVGDGRGGVIELEANRGDESNLYTNLDVQAGDVVTLSFDMSARLHYEGADSQVDIYFEGMLIDSLSPEEAGWESHTYQLTATTDNPRLEFDSPDDNSLGGLLDAITVVKDIIEDQAVPIVIDSAVLDTDGSESLQSIVIDGLPDGATLTDGEHTFTASGDDNSADVLGWDLSSLSFQGAENFYGPVSLVVTSTTVENSTLNDEVPETASTTSLLEFEVQAVNDAAVVTSTDIDGTEDTAITFTQEMLLQNATDIDSSDLTAINLHIDKEYGDLVDNNDGTFTFTPAADYNGDVPFTFDVDDNDGAVTPASGNLDIAAVNDAPVLAETSYIVNEDGSIVITEASLIANAKDVDNDVLSVASISADEHGTVTQSDNGDWVYTPDADYSGDANLTITLNDGTVDATFNAPVTVTPDADAPSLTVSLTDMTLAEYGVGQDSTLTGWHTDNHHNHIEIHQDYVYGVGDGRGGVIELEANRGDESNLYTNLDVQAGDVVTLSFDMSARLHYEGADSQVDIYFEGVLIDSLSPEEAGWESHTYQLTATTDNPRLEFDSPDDNSLGGLLDAITVVKDIIEDQAVPIVIDSAALDTDGSESLQSIVIDGLPDGATLTDGENTFTASGDDNSADVLGWDLSSLSFQGAENFNGPVSLVVTSTTVENSTINDEVPETASTTSLLEFEVQAVNDAVVIDAGSVPQFNTDEDTEIIITEAALLANASDVDGDDLIVTNLAIGNASFKTVIDSETGEKLFIVTPNQDVNGDLSITFNVSDQNGSLVASDGILTVEAVNDAVVVDDQAFTINEDGTITFTDDQLLLNASDVDHDELTVDSVTYGGADGVFTEHGDGTYTFAPNENFNGDVDLSFTVSDGTVLTPANIDIHVEAVNDIPVAGSTSYSVDEDGILTFTDAQLLANSSDVEGEVSIDAVTYSGADGILTNNGNGTYSFAPNPNFDGDVAFDVTVKDEDGATAITTANVDVLAVNDTPVVTGNVAYNVNEDGTITLTQEQLLMHASDVDGDDLTATNLQLEAFGSVEKHEDGSFTITPAENFNGDLQLTFDVTDGQETVSTGLDLTVNPVNDPVVAKDDSSLDGMDPLIRLDAAPEHGSVQYLNEDGEWADMVIGLTYPADTQVQFTPNTEEIQADTRDIRVGSFDSDTSTRIFDGTATVDDWGTVDGDTAVYVEDGVTITTQVNTGELAAWNGAGSHKGAGIGNDSRNGLDTNEMLTVTVEGEDVNQITFQLDGLGSYFDKTSSHATEVNIKAFDADGNLIDTQGGYRDSGEYQDTYAFTTDVPVHHFTLGTTGSDGTYVVQNMTVSRTMSEEIQMTTIQSDGSEISNALNLDLNHSTADQTLDVTEQLIEVNTTITSRAIEVEEDGQLVIQAADLLMNDSDADGDTLSISAVEATEATHGEVSLDEDGNVVFTPDADYNGPASFTYTVTDGNGSYDTATVSVNVTPVDDLPVAPSLSLNVDEDQVLVIDPAYILSQANDVDGDQLALESLSLKQPQNGSLQLQQDGMYHLITPPDFNGLIELDYQISDGNNVVDGGMKVDVLPVNDAPFNGGNAHLTTYEEGTFTFNANDMLDLFGDIDGDNLVISRIINADGDEKGTIEDNEDGTWTFTPMGDYAGTAELQIEVSDPDGLTTMLTMPVFVRPVADGAVITTDHDGPVVFDEDTTGLLGLNVDMIDSSEVLSHLVITGFPVGFEVSDGVHSVMITELGQIVDVTEWSFNDLSLTPPQDFSGNFFITVSATTADYGETASSQITQPTDTYADFEVAESGALTLTTADLLAMADDIETSASDEIHGVHLIDRSQGELVDNGDGTWLFTPADGVSGNVDFAYQINHDGESSDVQSSIAVNEAGEADSNIAPINTAPSVDAVVTTEIDAGNTLTFNDDDMLAQLSDAQGDTLSIESVQLITGQGVLETNSDGEYTFAPAEGYTGEAHIAFVATDGEESVRSHFTVNINEAEDDSSKQGSDFTLDEFGALHLAENDILAALNLDSSVDVTSMDYNGDAGALVDKGDGNWVFWTDDDFNGQLDLDVNTTDGNSATIHSLQLDVAEYEDSEAPSPAARQADEPSIQETHDTQTVTLDAQEGQDNGSTNDTEADITAAPGSTIRVDIPDDVTSNSDVDQVEISNLPEGATISNGILNDDGSYTISGNLSRPVKIELADENEGKQEITFEGQSEMGTPIEGATGTVTIEVDDNHAMQSGHRGNDNPRGMHDDDDSKGDWMQGDNRDQGVDAMDDSASYENDEHTAQQDDSNVMDDNYS